MLWWTLRQLKSEDAGTREKAARKFGESKDRRAVEPLVAALVDEILCVEAAAAKPLVQMTLSWVQWAAPTRFTPWGGGFLRPSDRELYARMEAGYARDVHTFVVRLKCQSSRVRSATEEALDMIEPNWAKSEAAGRVAWKLVSASCGPARDALNSIATDLEKRFGKQVEPTVAALKDVASDMAQAAAELMGKIGDVRAMLALVTTLEDRRSHVRQAAADTLGRVVAAHAVKQLVATLKDDDDFVKLADARAVEFLVATLKDDDDRVQQAAAEALGKIADARAVEPLVAALKDETSRVRKTAAEALGYIGDGRAAEPLLVAARKDDDSDVRQAAEDALKSFGRRLPGMAEPGALLGALPRFIIVFRPGADQPQNPLAYSQHVVSRKYQCDASKVELDAWRIVGVRHEPDADSARRLYVLLKRDGRLPDFAPPSDIFEGKGPDGRTVVAFFFATAASKKAPPARIALDVNYPVCALCGNVLGGGESILTGATRLITPQPSVQLNDDYALFRGSICFNCRVLLCTECLGERVDQCPKCKGGTKPAYRHYLRELAAL
jgi:HEAT repeat protein